MKKRIAVVGMGQGGMVAAIFLAREYDVTVFEKEPKGKVGYDWKDDIRLGIFDELGLKRPDKEVYCQKAKWLFMSPGGNILRLPRRKDSDEISVWRNRLVDYFCRLAETAGCKLKFGTEVEGLVVSEEKTVGIKYDGREENFDLVIDASGLFSRLRKDVPDKYCVTDEPAPGDVLYSYRAFFRATPGEVTVDPTIESTMIIKHLGTEGISWCNLNEEGELDVLIGKIGTLNDEEIEERLKDLRRVNPILSEEKLRERKVPICLRGPIATPVADGYIAIGDSAFMPVPIMGSGIETSMKAGRLFAEYITDKNIVDFTAENMWGFFVEYMDKCGGRNFMFLDFLRRYAFKLSTEEIDDVFSSGIITDDDLKVIMLAKDDPDRPKIKASAWAKKLFLPLRNKSLRKAIKAVHRADRATRVIKKLPRRYNRDKIRRWKEAYERALLLS